MELVHSSVGEDKKYTTFSINNRRYLGNKYKLNQFIKSIINKECGEFQTFTDLFAGTGAVASMFQEKHLIVNDILYSNYVCHQTWFGYEDYRCNSNTGLAPYNKDKFLRLREDFNKIKNIDYYYYTLLYVLIIYSFNNQIRFNSQGKFNLPVGKRDFNEKMRLKLKNFIERLEGKNFEFSNLDFRKFDISKLNENSFVYADPPYLITCATYNEQGGWNSADENDLLTFLDKLYEKNIKFALSNVLRSKGKENSILINWTEKNSNKYKVINLNYDYKNSNYQTKNKESVTEEVLIINY